MDLDTNFKADFPFFSTIFLESPNLKQDLPENPAAVASRGLFHKPHASPDHHVFPYDHGLLPPQASPFDRYRAHPIEGSSSNPFGRIGVRPIVTYQSGRFHHGPTLGYCRENSEFPNGKSLFESSHGDDAFTFDQSVQTLNFCDLGTLNARSEEEEDVLFMNNADRTLTTDNVDSNIVNDTNESGETKRKVGSGREKRENPAQKKSQHVKGQWNAQEDRRLIQLVESYGDKKWREIAKKMEGRVGKQCRERWNNHLKPRIKKDVWTEEEDKLLIAAHKEIGNKWAEMSKLIPGRTENGIKNHWNATRRKHLSSSKRKPYAIRPPPSLLQAYIGNLPPPPPKETEAAAANKGKSVEDAPSDGLSGELLLRFREEEEEEDKYGDEFLIRDGYEEYYDEEYCDKEMKVGMDKDVGGDIDDGTKELDLLEIIAHKGA